jgi:hypothetical protein
LGVVFRNQAKTTPKRAALMQSMRHMRGAMNYTSRREPRGDGVSVGLEIGFEICSPYSVGD